MIHYIFFEKSEKKWYFQSLKQEKIKRSFFEQVNLFNIG